MTIECHSCHARFHLDDNLFKGSRGMLVRCRKCGEAIVVVNPKAPPYPPRAEARSVPSPPRSKDPPPKYEDDVARISTPVPQTKAAPHPQEQKTVTPAPPDPDRFDTAGSGPEQMWIEKPPEKTAAPRQKVSEPEEKLIDDRIVPSQDAAPPELRVASLKPSVDSAWSEEMGSRQQIHRLISPMSLHKQPTFIIAALLFLLLAGGAAYLGFTWIGKKPLNGLAVGTVSLLSGGVTTDPNYIIRSVSTYYVPRTASEKLFVLEGRVENRGRAVGRGIRVRVTLLNGTSRAVATKTFPAGHVFTDEELLHLDRARIEEGLSTRLGEDPNMEIPPGKFLPFMALFFDLQERIAFYQVAVQGAQ